MSRKKKAIEERYFNRRQFLIGSGSLLALPPLISLMPNQVLAQVMQPRVRVMTFIGVFGIDYHQLYPDSAISMNQDPNSLNTYYQNFSQLPNKVSRILDFSHPDLAGLQSKTNLIRGLGLAGGSHANHNHSVLSGTHSGGRSPIYGESIDVIIEKALKVKATRLKTVSNSFGKANEFSFSRTGGTRQLSSLTFGDQALFNSLFPGGITPPNTGTSTNTGPQKNELVIDKVLQDLNSMLSHQRLSNDDKLKLQEYAANVQDLQKRIIANNAPPAAGNVSCKKSSVSYHVNSGSSNVVSADKLYDNYADILALAIQCDQTRVVHIANTAISDLNSNGSHPELHHDATGGSDGAADRQAWFLRKTARFAKRLDSLIDPFDPQGKTLLDNSLLLWTNELGSWTTAHSVTTIPTVTFGSGGGYLRTGLFVDYRVRPFLSAKSNLEVFHIGRPYKQLLISCMQAAGLTKSQYINIGDGNGFGEFKVGFNGADPNAYSIYTNEHNEPLPFLSLKPT